MNKFNAKSAIESLDAQLDAVELVIDANIKTIEKLEAQNAVLSEKLDQLSKKIETQM